MDFLDPKRQRRNHLLLMIGYGLVTIAIAMATLVLLYQANGYGIDKKGQVVQNGLVFASSHPPGAAIYLNDTPYKSKTNTRMVLPGGTYQLKISASGYRDWQRQIVVNGNDVQHFDYPFLFPQKLATASIATLTAPPSMTSQSPDKRWLLIGSASDPATFSLYDFKNPKSPLATSLTIPDDDYTAGTGAQSWSSVEWAADNRHLLLLHTYTTASGSAREYVLLDRQDTANSFNASKSLNLAVNETLSLFNKKPTQFYALDPATAVLRTASTDNSLTPQRIEHVLAYKSYSDDTILYVTDHSGSSETPTGKVNLVFEQAQKTYTLRSLPAAAPIYTLDIAQYSGDWYVIAGASNDKSGLYIFKNPQAKQNLRSDGTVSSWRLLGVPNPTFGAFSSNTQYIVAENGQNFSVYDAENVNTYRYMAKEPIDQPQTHAVWMDGNRLLYVSGGKLLVFDYDYRNIQSLQATNPDYNAAFDSGYTHVYSVGPQVPSAASLQFDSTALTLK